MCTLQFSIYHNRVNKCNIPKDPVFSRTLLATISHQSSITIIYIRDRAEEERERIDSITVSSLDLFSSKWICYIDDKPIPHIRFGKPFHSCVDVVHAYQLNFWSYVMLCTKVQHLLGLFYPSNITSSHKLSPWKYKASHKMDKFWKRNDSIEK